jgi:hypothetical protein
VGSYAKCVTPVVIPGYLWASLPGLTRRRPTIKAASAWQLLLKDSRRFMCTRLLAASGRKLLHSTIHSIVTQILLSRKDRTMPEVLGLGTSGRSRPEKTVSSRMHLIFYWDSGSSVGQFSVLIGFGVPHNHLALHSVLLALKVDLGTSTPTYFCHDSFGSGALTATSDSLPTATRRCHSREYPCEPC